MASLQPSHLLELVLLSFIGVWMFSVFREPLFQDFHGVARESSTGFATTSFLHGFHGPSAFGHGRLGDLLVFGDTRESIDETFGDLGVDKATFSIQGDATGTSGD